MTTRTNARKREVRTKELPFKQRIANFISDNPTASKREVAKEFNITTKELSLILAKLSPNDFKSPIKVNDLLKSDL